MLRISNISATAGQVLDCPGSVEFQQDARNALMVADLAVVVCEPSVDKAMMAAPILKFLDDFAIPHCVFLNKVDHLAGTSVPEMMEAIQGASDRPVVLRHVPIVSGEDVTGYVDLASERALRVPARERIETRADSVRHGGKRGPCPSGNAGVSRRLR